MREMFEKTICVDGRKNCFLIEKSENSKAYHITLNKDEKGKCKVVINDENEILYGNFNKLYDDVINSRFSDLGIPIFDGVANVLFPETFDNLVQDKSLVLKDYNSGSALVISKEDSDIVLELKTLNKENCLAERTLMLSKSDSEYYPYSELFAEAFDNILEREPYQLSFEDIKNKQKIKTLF